MRKTIVVALGGNAIIEEGTEGTIAQQFENTRKSMDAIVGLIREGHRVVLSHGNGPQAGVHLIRHEAASSQVPPSPLNGSMFEMPADTTPGIACTESNKVRVKRALWG